MLPPLVAARLLNAIEGTPVVIDTLLSRVEPGAPLWDARPDPERFTLREVIAHLADYEDVWVQYLEQIRDTNEPTFAGTNPDMFAIANDYENSNPAETFARLQESRRKFVAGITVLEPAELQRIGHHPKHGDLSIETLTVLALAHDGYHVRQIAEIITGRLA